MVEQPPNVPGLLPASWLTALLVLALTSALLPGAFTALPVSVAVVLVLLLLSEALGSSAVAQKLAVIIAAVTGAPAGCALLATASRASSGRDCRLKRPTAR